MLYLVDMDITFGNQMGLGERRLARSSAADQNDHLRRGRCQGIQCSAQSHILNDNDNDNKLA